MCDKSLKGVQELQQILKTASKDGIDKETMGAKLSHMEQKLEELKDEIVRKNQSHKKDLKNKDKQIRKSKQAQRMLEEKVEQCKNKIKNNDASKNRSFNHAGGDKSEFNLESNEKHALERQVRKKREAQQKVRQCKKQIEELQQALAQKQRENQMLKQQLQIQKLLLDEFTNQKSECSSDQDKNSDDEEEEVSFHKKESQMMDLSEGGTCPRPRDEEEEPRKLSEDRQTDDQQDDDGSDQFCEKLISKAEQNELHEQLVGRQGGSFEESSIKMELVEKQIKQEVEINQSQTNEAVLTSEKQQKQIPTNNINNPQKEPEEAEPKSKPGWFSWQTWFGKSNK